MEMMRLLTCYLLHVKTLHIGQQINLKNNVGIVQVFLCYSLVHM